MATEHKIEIKKPAENEDPLEYYHKIIKQLVTLFKTTSQPRDKIGIVIANNDITTEPLALSYRYVHQLTPDVLWAVIFRATQSNQDFLLQGKISARVQVVECPVGCGRNRQYKQMLNPSTVLEKNRGIIQFDNKGRDCLARAIVVGRHLLHGKVAVTNILKDNCLLNREALQLCVEADVDLNNGGSYAEIQKFQNIMSQDEQIIVYSDLTGKQIFFKDNSIIESDRRVNLLLLEGHFSVIKSVTAVFACSYYCFSCNKPYEHKENHTCAGICNFVMLSLLAKKTVLKSYVKIAIEFFITGIVMFTTW